MVSMESFFRSLAGCALSVLMMVTLGSGVVSANSGSSTSGVIRGKILDATGAPIAGATVTLSNPVSGYTKQTQTDSNGSYTFFNVPFNPYTIKAEAASFSPTAESIEVRSSMATEFNLSLAVGATSDVVTVSADTQSILETESATTHVDIDKSLIQRFPASTATRGMESIILSTPGFMADENGRFHFRGSHGQVTYVVDGVPVSDQLNLTFSNSLDPNNVESMEVITGNMLPEFGGRNAAVINVTSRSALGSTRRFFGNLTLGGARFSTGEINAQFGGSISDKFGYFVSLGATRSNRFSDPVNFENLNNTGNTQRSSVRFDYAATPNDFLRLSLGAGRTERAIPNLLSQHAAGQNQNTLNKDFSINFTWQHTFNNKVSTDITPYFRTSSAQLLELTPFSTPLSAQQDRHLSNYGLNASVSYDEAMGEFHNHFKAGLNFFAFPVSENFNFAITDPNFNAPPEEERRNRRREEEEEEEFNPNLLPFDLTRGGTRFQFSDRDKGKQYSFFVQDSVTYKGLTLNGGVRYDNYRFKAIEDSWQPRVGIAYHINQTGTVLRAAYNRIFMTPFNENLLLASSDQAAALAPPFVVEAQGTARSVVRSERQHSYEVGIQQRIKNLLRFDFSYWTKDGRQASDNLQFLNTGVVFPVAFASSKLRGADFRVDMPNYRGFNAYWSIGTARAVYTPPFTGGLFLDPEVAELVNSGPFRIDHDQKVSSQFALQYTHAKQGWWLGLMQRYDSGLVTEIESVEELAADPDLAFGLDFVNFDGEPLRVKGRSVWNISAGYELFRKETYKVELQAHLLNLTNERGLYNFLSVFGGTHVIPPRTYAVRVKLNF